MPIITYLTILAALTLSAYSAPLETVRNDTSNIYMEVGSHYEKFVEYYIVCDNEMHQFMVHLDNDETELPTCENIGQPI